MMSWDGYDDQMLIMGEPDEPPFCHQPCHPDSGCPYCSDYWQRMISEGYWDRDRKRWTNKGWREMTK